MNHLPAIWTIFASCNIIVLLGAPSDPALFLTKHIKLGELEKAKELSADHMKQFHLKSSTNENLKSYSGYLTVNAEDNSNIFFWFFPALESPETAPVVMWSNENAGISCLQGVFLENGPFYLDENLELRDRNYTWVRTISMLYIDAPVGVGFSFTDKEEGYAKDTKAESKEVYEALVQFFTLFSDYADKDFYVAGEFIAAEHVPQVVTVIHDMNEKTPKVKINLKGVMLGSPVMNLPVQISWLHKYYYSMGVIDESQRDLMAAEEEKVIALIKEKKFFDSHNALTKIILFPGNMYQRLTGMGSSTSILQSKKLKEISRFVKFIETNEVHNYLHTGLHKFSFINWKVHDTFDAEDMMADGSGIETILNYGYRVLLHSGQFDPSVVHPGLTASIEMLKWKGAEEYKKSPREIWKVGDDIAGYVRSGGNLTYAFIRNTGRYAMIDEPLWGHELVERFTRGRPLND